MALEHHDCIDSDAAEYGEDCQGIQIIEAFAPVEALPTKVLQIQAVQMLPDHNCGPHAILYALCEDGSIWQRIEASCHNNVPTDGLWRVVNKPTIAERQSRCLKCMGSGKLDFEVLGSFDCPWCSR